MPSVGSISQQIWDMKYRLKGPDGAPLDKTIEDTWRRVATCARRAREATRAPLGRALLRGAGGFQVPAGRAASSPAPARGRHVTLFNCFVMGDDPGRYGRASSRICAKPR